MNVKNNYLDKINFDNLPKHIAIIMDGNGRWAEKRFLPRTSGHKEGVKRVMDTVEECGNLGIKYLTLYAFSTENWSRPKKEIDYLMKLLVKFIKNKLEEIHKNNVKLNILGDLNRFDKNIIKEVEYAVELTKNNSKLILNIALNYGGRDEIVRATKRICNDIINNNISIEEINEEYFKRYLYTENQSDPDIVIRTSGEKRLSNFLNYQIAYSEFFFLDINWPDFHKNSLHKVIFDYQQRNRRFGNI
ncbi:isoprenyl transferase [Clostridium sp. D2Q-14]|uniref:isoprenyl transferase n=1 Tax=Anaeromonas gelatinilytica TaxID=2683194 RepID=UPI00193AF873|nr:isoprenyl transferase [Anaeromonas gelatinilytica]MBS4536018.1 isoprenyl transferase [Anaeromonas gelatinilytica]